jgi:hypothetical protein
MLSEEAEENHVTPVMISGLWADPTMRSVPVRRVI